MTHLHALRSFMVLTILLTMWCTATPASAADTQHHFSGSDAFRPPSLPSARTAAADTAGRTPDRYQPSAFMAGRIAVQMIFIESTGSAEPSTEDWTSDEIGAVQSHVDEALTWWQNRLPNAHITFDLSSQVVDSQFEPIQHPQNEESQWIGDVLGHLGYAGANYFDQAYSADEALRQARGTDWATTIFVVNSAADLDGRFPSGHFAYAYIGGPFMVVTSDAGPYGTNGMTPAVTHELGHIFGALDQYAAAAPPCTERSGYLAVENTNSQLNDCGTHFICIMLDPQSAYPGGILDVSALGQIGYRDQDGDGIPDPLDTTPTLQISVTNQLQGRPSITGNAIDQPFPSPNQQPATINTIKQIEYRVDGGAWTVLPPSDGAYSSSVERIDTTLPLYDGDHQVELRAVNSVGNASPIVSTTVRVHGVGAAPQYEAQAPKLSNSANITMGLAAPADTLVQISETSAFAGAAWSPVTSTTNHQLGSDDGEHTLYIRFRDSRALESPVITQTVLLDQQPPTGQAQIREGATPQLELEAHDTTSGVAAVQLMLDHQPQAWQPFQPTLDLPRGATSVELRLRDAAGNISQPIDSQRVYQLNLPVTTSG